MRASYDFRNLEFRHSGILESPGFVPESILNAKFQNFIIPGIFQESCRTLEFLLEVTFFCQGQQIGCFSHAIFGPERNIQLWLTHKEKTWSSLAYACFCQFQNIGYYSYLVFIHVHDFQCFNSKFHHFWNLLGNIWKSWIPLKKACF